MTNGKVRTVITKQVQRWLTSLLAGASSQSMATGFRACYYPSASETVFRPNSPPSLGTFLPDSIQLPRSQNLPLYSPLRDRHYSQTAVSVPPPKAAHAAGLSPSQRPASSSAPRCPGLCVRCRGIVCVSCTSLPLSLDVLRPVSSFSKSSLNAPRLVQVRSPPGGC